MEAEKHEEPAFDLEAAIDQAIAACDGDMRATVRALVVANNFLAEHNDACHSARQQLMPCISNARWKAASSCPSVKGMPLLRERAFANSKPASLMGRIWPATCMFSVRKCSCALTRKSESGAQNELHRRMLKVSKQSNVVRVMTDYGRFRSIPRW